jgi:hypothetical protein
MRLEALQVLTLLLKIGTGMGNAYMLSAELMRSSPTEQTTRHCTKTHTDVSDALGDAPCSEPYVPVPVPVPVEGMPTGCSATLVTLAHCPVSQIEVG